MGRHSVVGTATRYGLEGPVIKFRWGRDFPYTSRLALGPTQPVQWVTGPFPGINRPGRGLEDPPPPRAEVKERVELYFYSLSGSPWTVLG